MKLITVDFNVKRGQGLLFDGLCWKSWVSFISLFIVIKNYGVRPRSYHNTWTIAQGAHDALTEEAGSALWLMLKPSSTPHTFAVQLLPENRQYFRNKWLYLVPVYSRKAWHTPTWMSWICVQIKWCCSYFSILSFLSFFPVLLNALKCLESSRNKVDSAGKREWHGLLCSKILHQWERVIILRSCSAHSKWIYNFFLFYSFLNSEQQSV